MAVKKPKWLQLIAQITKAVFPVAGLGTRMFPATKAIPKEIVLVTHASKK